MGVEIERKFLVTDPSWPQPPAGIAMRQGYLAAGPSASVRVRLAAGHAWLGVKERRAGACRTEFEYPIPPRDAEVMLATLCAGRVIDKTRFRVEYEGHTWEVDVFAGANEGLVLAEVELQALDEPLQLPPWVGREVTGERRYYSESLADEPHSRWPTPDS